MTTPDPIVMTQLPYDITRNCVDIQILKRLERLKADGLIESWYNGGLTYCDPQTCKSHANDYSKNYPRIMANKNFKVPDKSGNEVILNSLPLKMISDLGYYRIKNNL